MTNGVKKRVGIAVAGVALLLVVGYGFFRSVFHTMSIEDRYGDLQYFYFRSENGVLILNFDLRRVGMVRKTRRFMHILENDKEVDLYEWVYPREQETKVAVYRVEVEELNVRNVGYDQLLHLIETQQAELVIDN